MFLPAKAGPRDCGARCENSWVGPLHPNSERQLEAFRCSDALWNWLCALFGHLLIRRQKGTPPGHVPSLLSFQVRVHSSDAVTNSWPFFTTVSPKSLKLLNNPSHALRSFYMASSPRKLCPSQSGILLFLEKDW